MVPCRSLVLLLVLPALSLSSSACDCGGELEHDAGEAAQDAGRRDAGGPIVDAGGADAGDPDSGHSDAGHSDAGHSDAGHSDAGHSDAGNSDAGDSDAGGTTLTAPPVSPGVSTTLLDATGFLYGGDDPVQHDLDAELIDPERVAVIRGDVTDGDGEPLNGVRVAVLGHPELGYTYSGAMTPGRFDLALNGGGQRTLVYEKEGFLKAQRKVHVPWQDYAWAPEVALVPVDAAVTTIDLSAAFVQSHQGSSVSDDDGERKATLLFPVGTQATAVLPDGTEQPLGTLSVRTTEYTVGDNGRQRMPADLPPNIAYTYAVELSVDEAMASGAARVDFAEPVVFYVENFLDFPVGGAVPTGYYDFELAGWVPADNGVIVQVVGIEDGLAELSTDPDGTPLSASKLEGLGVDDEERAEVAALYGVGDVLWRVPIPHFSPWDCNWPYAPPDTAEAPAPPEPEGDANDPPLDGESEGCLRRGSIIECQRQSLGDRVPLDGARHELHYRSDREPGRRTGALDITLSNESVPESLSGIHLVIEVAGQRIHEHHPPTAELTRHWVWDERDGYGRRVYGSHPIKVRVGYEYPGVYVEPGSGESSFGQWGGASIQTDRERQLIVFWEEWRGLVRASSEPHGALGGWTLDVHHSYDVSGRALVRGDGVRRDVSSIPPVIETVAGDGDDADWQDGDDALDASLDYFRGVGAGPDGSVYFSEAAKVSRLAPDGTLHRFAGTGTAGNWEPQEVGGSVPALEAPIGDIYGITAAADGRVFLADQVGRVRMVDADGDLHNVVGTDGSGSAPAEEGGLAHETPIYSPSDVVAGPSGALYFAETSKHRVRRLGLDGRVYTVAGYGSVGYSGDGGLATSARLYAPVSLAISPEGVLYIADHGNARIRRVGLDGIITTFAGGGSQTEDGIPATSASLPSPRSIALAPDGGLLVLSYNRVRYINRAGIIATVTGDGDEVGEGVPAASAKLLSPEKMDVAPNGDILVIEEGTSSSFTPDKRVRRVRPALGGFNASSFAVSSRDGEELYDFDAGGTHQRTLDTRTGAVRYSFGYDDDGRLSTVSRGDGSSLIVERDANGAPTALEAPGGWRTELGVDEHGYLSQVGARAYAYSPSGLLLERTDGRGDTSLYEYESERGRLVRAEDASGAAQTFERVELTDGYEVVHTSGEGRATTYRVERLLDGGRRLTTVFPSGAELTSVVALSGVRTTTLPDGTVDVMRVGPDPRFGMQAPVPTERTITTAGGRQLSYDMTREVVLEGADPLALQSLTETISVDGATTQTIYDPETHTYTETSAEGRQRSWRIDELGRVIERAREGMAPTSLEYDEQGRLARVTEGEGAEARVTDIGYDEESELVDSLTDALGGVHGVLYDAGGHPAELVRPDGQGVSLARDEEGAVVALTPPERPPHAFVYGPGGVFSEYLPPEVEGQGSPLSLSYDADRLVTLASWPGGREIEIVYGADGELSSLTTSRGQTLFSYDEAFRPVAIEAPEVTLALAWDGRQVTRQEWSGAITGSVSREHDARARVSLVQVNDATDVALAYDYDGLLTAAGELLVTRDATHGRVVAATLDGVSEARSYTAFGELEELSASAGDLLLALSYSYDELGRITDKIEEVEGEEASAFSYGYDLAGRLVEVRSDDVVVEAYSYDANGNRLGADEGAGIIDATYDDRDRLVAHGQATFAYSSDGYLASRDEDGQSTSYTYDELGELTAVALPDGREITYVIDGIGRRVGKAVDATLVQGFLYQDGLNAVAELDGAGQITNRFVYGTRRHVPDYLIRDGERYRMLTDIIGSVRLVVHSDSGAVVQRLDYDGFGRVVHEDTADGFDQPFRFAGGLLDRDTGLLRFGTRDYDPNVGRWLGRDPLGFAAGQTNLYAYVDNDPVNAIDPTGLILSPGDVGREVGDRGCEVECGRQYENCRLLSPHIPGFGGFDYDACFEDCSERIDDAISDVELVFDLGELPNVLHSGADVVRAGGNWVRGKF